MAKDHEPRRIPPEEKGQQPDDTLYALRHKRGRFGVPHYRVSPISHPYFGTRSEGGYTPGGIFDNRTAAEEAAKELWSAAAPSPLVILASIKDPSLLQRRKDWAKDHGVNFWTASSDNPVQHVVRGLIGKR